MPYTEASLLVQKSINYRTRIMIVMMGAVIFLFIFFIASLFVVGSRIDENSQYTRDVAQAAVEQAGGAKCRSRIVNQYLVSIGDLLEEDGEIGADPDNPEDARRESDTFKFYREQSRALSTSPPGEGPCDNVNANGQPIEP